MTAGVQVKQLDLLLLSLFPSLRIGQLITESGNPRRFSETNNSHFSLELLHRYDQKQ
jgi:hypothetical protein